MSNKELEERIFGKNFIIEDFSIEEEVLYNYEYISHLDDLLTCMVKYPESIDEVARIVDSIDWADDYEDALVCYIEDYMGSPSNFFQAYLGVYESEVEFAKDYIEDVMDGPKSLLSYIDYEKLARDLFTDYDFIKGHVFRNC